MADIDRSLNYTETKASIFLKKDQLTSQNQYDYYTFVSDRYKCLFYPVIVYHFIKV